MGQFAMRIAQSVNPGKYHTNNREKYHLRNQSKIGNPKRVLVFQGRSTLKILIDGYTFCNITLFYLSIALVEFIDNRPHLRILFRFSSSQNYVSKKALRND